MALTKAKVHGLTIAASIVLHAGVAAVLAAVAYGAVAARPAEASAAPSSVVASVVSVELPAVGSGVFADEQPIDPLGDPPRLTAGQELPRLDTGVGGHGGTTSVREPALNLADDDERMRLSPDPLNRLDRDQLQRLRVARVRSSWEDRRSTTHPAELTLVVSGTDTVFERRAEAEVQPSRGALDSPPASLRGATPGAATVAGEGLERERGSGGASAGARETAPGRGLMEGRSGADHRISAPIASARPAVVLGPVAVPAVDRANPKDDVDGRQEVATALRSLVHASSAGGIVGDGPGGSEWGGEAGSGGTVGAGSHATPLGAGAGDVFDYWTSDPRLVSYFRSIHAKIDPLWADAFPRSALFDLKQGTVVLDFTVYADGHAVVSWPPHRPSGVDEFDRNCAEAIRRAAPFPPIPHQLAGSELHIRAPFVASNPIIK